MSFYVTEHESKPHFEEKLVKFQSSVSKNVSGNHRFPITERLTIHMVAFFDTADPFSVDLLFHCGSKISARVCSLCRLAPLSGSVFSSKHVPSSSVLVSSLGDPTFSSVVLQEKIIDWYIIRPFCGHNANALPIPWVGVICVGVPEGITCQLVDQCLGSSLLRVFFGFTYSHGLS